ncbi:39576_t:CDS:2 [Gigaspora margarita]|uniref:39576_t:CDS:1 n=1 Tax=Gigaspora margarita TaxID=4874 RepID=A0ABN7UBA7_GIGMA|nr:39576_t:CDS:2 [Gigaspora margarita]
MEKIQWNACVSEIGDANSETTISVISYTYFKEDIPVPDIQFFSEFYLCWDTALIILNQLKTTATHISQIHQKKNGSYYNGYFSVPFKKRKYKLPLSLDINENSFMFSNQFMAVSDNPKFFVKVFVSGKSSLEKEYFSMFLQSIIQVNTYEFHPGDSTH